MSCAKLFGTIIGACFCLRITLNLDEEHLEHGLIASSASGEPRIHTPKLAYPFPLGL